MSTGKRTIHLLVVLLLCLSFGGVVTGTAAAVPVDWETDNASGGTPDDDKIVCTEVDPWWGGAGCWQHDGDVIWVLNYSDLNATVWWWNYYPNDSTLYRQGKCRYQFYGDWGYCNKNMHEDSLIRFRICDRFEDAGRRCSPIYETRA